MKTILTITILLYSIAGWGQSKPKVKDTANIQVTANMYQSPTNKIIHFSMSTGNSSFYTWAWLSPDGLLHLNLRTLKKLNDSTYTTK